MKEILAYFKETDNKLRWDAILYDENEEKVKLELYLQKWRVPEPCPEEVKVEIGKPHEFPDKILVTEEDVIKRPDLREVDLYAELEKFRDHTKTTRYNPTEEYRSSGSGDVYIPIVTLNELACETGDDLDKLAIQVGWR
ncbi:MAG: hypothetical protein KAT37_03880 [Candidatus Aenigmarchaeota archaeon]|nr:hypothetical protein [Candidatus Aenigmarchaeota archaeon]